MLSDTVYVTVAAQNNFSLNAPSGAWVLSDTRGMGLEVGVYPVLMHLVVLGAF